MSSQGPAGGTGAGYAISGCNLTGTPSQSPTGYAFNKTNIRDASDWIKFKKQALIYNDPQVTKSKDPWFVHGNDFRLEWLNGENKCVP